MLRPPRRDSLEPVRRRPPVGEIGTTRGGSAMAWNPAFRMVRPDDMVVLDVSVSGPPPKKVASPAPGGATHVFEKVTDGREIRVQFGPQQIIEYATPATG